MNTIKVSDRHCSDVIIVFGMKNKTNHFLFWKSLEKIEMDKIDRQDT